ncbi:MAG TPA: thiol-disulfide isomerase [Bryobacteraceae bacterium]|jgi:hypothetical protein
MMGIIGVLLGVLAGTAFAADSITFHKNVEPILQAHCQSCHRPGQTAPMSLLSYESARPWAKAIKTAVLTRKMPPWFADPRYGHFTNDRSLKQTDIETIAQWADAGAPEGSPKEAPASINWPADGWEIQPDIVINGPGVAVPAKPKANVIEWTYITVPGGFKEDTWVTSMEIRPSEPLVTHHICVYFKPHSENTEYNTPVWSPRARDQNGIAPAEAAGANGRNLPKSVLEGTNGPEGCYVPGQYTQNYRLFHAAKLIKAGTDMVFQLHYTPNGKDVVDHPRLGFTVAKTPAERVYVTIGTSAPSDPKHFAIPPNNPNWESPPMEAEFLEDAELVSMFPHMHVRGKDMTYQLTYPNGETETILSVPRYDFNWQLGYDVSKPIKIPKGTRMKVTAHFDNSANNKFNPDPNQTVYYGDMTWEEMMFPFFSVTVDSAANARKVIRIIRGKDGDGA